MAGFVDKFKRMWDAPDDEYEYDEYGYSDDRDDDFDEIPVRERERDRKQKRQGAGLRASRIRSHLRGPDSYQNPCLRTAVPTPEKRILREQG